MEPSLVKDIFKAVDAMDADAFAAFLTEDATFRFGNADPVAGKENIRQAVAGFFSSISGLSHSIQQTWIHPDSAIANGEVTYTRKDNSKITLPFAVILGMQDGLISRYQIYADISPLYAAGS